LTGAIRADIYTSLHHASVYLPEEKIIFKSSKQMTHKERNHDRNINKLTQVLTGQMVSITIVFYEIKEIVYEPVKIN